LTDDDLSRQLSGAFHNASDGLSYDGSVPVARSGPSARWLAVPAVAAVAVAAATTAAHQGGAPSRGLSGSASVTASSSSPTIHPPRIVTAKIEVAGYTLDYDHPVGESVPANDLYADLSVDAVPSDATPTDSNWPGAKAWVGTDPDSGDNALFLQGPGIAGGGVFALISPTWTQQQLSQLVLEDVAFPVPAVG